MICDERERIFAKFTLAVNQHAGVIRQIIKLMDSGQGEGLLEVLVGAAEAKADCDRIREELDLHRAAHGC